MNRIPARAALAAALALLSLPAAAALDVAGIDKEVDACTDFYQYANRKWLQSTPIPDDRARWGTFEIIAERNEKLLVDALNQELRTSIKQRKYARGSPEWMAVRYYQSGMNENRIEYATIQPIARWLEQAGKVATPADLAAALAALHARGFGGGFNFDIDVDAKDSGRYLPEVSQGGLGLPDRDYYFLDDERSRKLREGYLVHVARMLEMLGASPEQAQRDAAAVMALETDLARASMTAVERRDVDKTYNKMTLAELAAQAPGFPWAGYFKALGAPQVAELNVAQPEFMKAFARMAGEKRPEWPVYLRWHVIHAAASKLDKRFEQEDFDFYERQFRGVKVQPPRHRRVLQTIGGRFGESGVGMALGRIYVDKAFSPEAKARALELVNNVKAALTDRLKAADWMTEETRKRSLEKVAAMQIKIGYPDKWRDYGGARIGVGNYVENWMAANEFDLQRVLARIGKAVDRSEWYMSPHIVNAYYNPSGNEIVFPAAILQPPYFDMKADDPLNYGGIGMVIGHEITHGFDNRGRRYDKDGNLRDWWTAEDARRYQERAAHVERQYSAFEGIEAVKVNGTLTLGENLSDIGGMKIAYDALQKALKGKPRKPIDGLTPEQRFFLAFAQAWRSTARLEWERNSLITGQHSLPRFRVRGPIAHMPEFARAFSCDPAKTLVTDIDQAKIW